jgi:hypothetical protein
VLSCLGLGYAMVLFMGLVRVPVPKSFKAEFLVGSAFQNGLAAPLMMMDTLCLQEPLASTEFGPKVSCFRRRLLVLFSIDVGCSNRLPTCLAGWPARVCAFLATKSSILVQKRFGVACADWSRRWWRPVGQSMPVHCQRTCEARPAVVPVLIRLSGSAGCRFIPACRPARDTTQQHQLIWWLNVHAGCVTGR